MVIYERRIMPFYMAYPMPMFGQQENTVMRDLEYMQQMYPKEAKHYQKLIAGILDKMDYEGSMIYDEYPDREFLYRELLKVRERHPEETMGGTEEQDLLQVLFVNEIYRRRILNRVEN